MDFVVDGPDGTAVPIEVKSGSYYHAHAALGHVLDTAEYGVRLGIVFSRGNVERNGAVLYLPLYATWALSDVLGDSCAKGIKLEVKPVYGQSRMWQRGSPFATFMRVDFLPQR